MVSDFVLQYNPTSLLNAGSWGVKNVIKSDNIFVLFLNLYKKKYGKRRL